MVSSIGCSSSSRRTSKTGRSDLSSDSAPRFDADAPEPSEASSRTGGRPSAVVHVGITGTSTDVSCGGGKWRVHDMQPMLKAGTMNASVLAGNIRTLCACVFRSDFEEASFATTSSSTSSRTRPCCDRHRATRDVRDNRRTGASSPAPTQRACIVGRTRIGCVYEAGEHAGSCRQGTIVYGDGRRFDARVTRRCGRGDLDRRGHHAESGRLGRRVSGCADRCCCGR